MMIPGILFIALGVFIILYPQILAWLIAIALIVMGIAMLMMINFMRGIGKRPLSAPKLPFAGNGPNCLLLTQNGYSSDH
jgi:cytochrome c biogenesis protein CcdA